MSMRTTSHAVSSTTSRTRSGDVAVTTSNPSGATRRRSASRTSRWSSATRMRGGVGMDVRRLAANQSGVPPRWVRKRGAGARRRCAVEQIDRPIGVTREPLVVSDHADRSAVGVQLVEQGHDRVAVLRIEVAGRLVGEQDQPARPAEGSCHRDPLLLAARELRWISVLRCDGPCRPDPAPRRRADFRSDAATSCHGNSTAKLYVFERPSRSPMRLKLWKMKPI